MKSTIHVVKKVTERVSKTLKVASDKTRNRVRKPWSYYIWQKSQKTGLRVRVTVVVKPQVPYILPASQRKPGVVVISRLPRQKVVSGRMRSLKKRTIPTTNPYTRSQTIKRGTYRYTLNKQPQSTQPNSSVSYSNWTRSRTGSALPKWQAIIRAGGNATTALTASEDLLAGTGGGMQSITYQSRPNPSSPWENYRSFESNHLANVVIVGPIGQFTSGASTEAQDQAVKQLYRKIYQARHQLQGGVILGEIDKTARLLMGTARNLKRGVLSYLGNAVGIRRGSGSRVSKRKAIANTYLESTYGWQPLIMDARDLAKTLGRLCHESDRVRFSAIGSSARQLANASQSARFADLFATALSFDIHEVVVVYKGIFRSTPYEAGSPPLERIIQMSGFDLRSFVPTMWELVPHSFLVDYFSNVGDCLYALSCDTSIVQMLWRTQISESRRIYVTTPDTAASIAQHKSSGGINVRNFIGESAVGHLSITRQDISRAVASVPIMVPKLTGVDLPWRQFANIGALITSKSR